MRVVCIRCPRLLRPLVRLFVRNKRAMDAFERHEPPKDWETRTAGQERQQRENAGK